MPQVFRHYQLYPNISWHGSTYGPDNVLYCKVCLTQFVRPSNCPFVRRQLRDKLIQNCIRSLKTVSSVKWHFRDWKRDVRVRHCRTMDPGTWRWNNLDLHTNIVPRGRLRVSRHSVPMQKTRAAGFPSDTFPDANQLPQDWWSRIRGGKIRIKESPKDAGDPMGMHVTNERDKRLDPMSSKQKGTQSVGNSAEIVVANVEND